MGASEFECMAYVVTQWYESSIIVMKYLPPERAETAMSPVRSVWTRLSRDDARGVEEEGNGMYVALRKWHLTQGI